MKLVFLGPPGAGKGTQAKILAKNRGLAHISTGEMLRNEVQGGSALGSRVKDIMEAGHLVPDDLIVEIIQNRVRKEDCKNGYILDGFPRTIPQARALAEMLDKDGLALDAVLSFELSEKAVLDRLAHRRGMEARPDDTAATQVERLKVYVQQTAPLIDYYVEKGLIREVDANGSIDEVSERVLKVLG